MNDSRDDETVLRANHHPVRPQSVRMDLEIAAIVLAVAGSTFTACALAVTTLLASYTIRALCAGCLCGLRGDRARTHVGTAPLCSGWRSMPQVHETDIRMLRFDQMASRSTTQDTLESHRPAPGLDKRDPIRGVPARLVPDNLKTGVDRPDAFLQVGRGGVEPPTFRFSGGRSYRLSYLPPRS